MNSIPFRVLPWEHDGIAPTPSQVLEARVEGRTRRFEVKWREGRAFFREADEADDRVWATWNELANDGWESRWRSAVESGQIGRYFVIERAFSTRTVRAEFEAELKRRFHPSNLNLLDATPLAVIVGDDNRGRAREWWGGAWLDFQLAPRIIKSGAFKPSIWHRGWNAQGLRHKLAILAGELAFRAFAPPADALGWRSGSQRQLEALYRAAHLVFAPPYRAKRRVPQFWRATNSDAPSRYSCSLRSDFGVNWRPGPTLDSLVPDELLRVFVAHNFPRGVQWLPLNRVWHDSDEQGNSIERGLPAAQAALRVDYEMRTHVIFSIEVPSQPSAHEQLEARLLLLDWMRATLPPAQTEQLRKYFDA